MGKKQTRKAISISGLAHAALKEHIAGTTMTVSGVVEQLIRSHLKMEPRPLDVKVDQTALSGPGVRFSIKSYPTSKPSVEPRFEPPQPSIKSKPSLNPKPAGTVPSTSRLDAIKSQNAARPPVEKSGLNVFRPDPTLTIPGKRMEVKRMDDKVEATPLSAVDAAAKIFTF